MGGLVTSPEERMTQKKNKKGYKEISSIKTKGGKKDQ